MKITYITSNDVDRIPKIGDELPLSKHCNFKVTGYGNQTDRPDLSYNNGKYIGVELELEGNMVIKAGTPISIFERILEKGIPE